jgi:hypothetical protein
MPVPPGATSRRKFLGQLSALCAAGLAAPGVCAASPAMPADRKAFRFLVVNDLHHGEPECTPFFEKLVAQMRGHGPVAFCLVVGDLSDNGRPESLVAVGQTFAALGIPVHPVPGNHDCDVEQNTRIYAEHFPGRLNYHFAHEGWQFIGLDTTEANAWHDTNIPAATLEYLDEALPNLDRAAPTVVFTHFPLGPTGWLTPLNAAEALRRFDGFNLRAALCGHYHARTVHAHGGAVLVTNTCCSRLRHTHDGTLPEGYQLCAAHPDGRLERFFIEFEPARKPEASPPLSLSPKAPESSAAGS